jgi:hypothetical protein
MNKSYSSTFNEIRVSLQVKREISETQLARLKDTIDAESDNVYYEHQRSGLGRTRANELLERTGLLPKIKESALP